MTPEAVANSWPIALGAVLLLALVILILLLVLLRRAAKVSKIGQPDEPEEEKPQPIVSESDEASGAVGSVFRRAGRLLKKSASEDRYDIPFYVLLGSDNSRDADLLASSGLDLPFGDAAEAEVALGGGRGFYFYDHGVVLDVAGPQVLRQDGAGSDDRGWRTTLQQLQKLRPKRPVDGVIVTFSCEELLDASRNEAARSELTTRASRIYRKIGELQQQLGFRLPAYILLTRGEKLTGFTTLCASLPPRGRQEILGWSSPYSVETAYRGDWVNEAFNALGARIDDLTMEVFSEGIKDGGDLLQLPREIRSVATPLRIVLDQIFRTSTYHGALMLRGIYFTGREADPLDRQQLTPRTAFLYDFLDRKVFPENGLALPSSRIVSARHRSVLIAKVATIAAAIFFTVGLAWAFWSLRVQEQQLVAFLEETYTDVQWVQTKSATGSIPDGELQEAAGKLLGGMSTIDFRRYDSWFIPASWFSAFREQLSDAVGEAFQEVILEAVRSKLDEKARQIIGNASHHIVPVAMPVAQYSPIPSGNTLLLHEPQPAAVLAVEQLPDFQRLQKFLTELRALEGHASSFNDLASRGAGDMKSFNSLVHYVFGKHLPPNFHRRSELYSDVLREVDAQPFRPDSFRPLAHRAAREMTDEIYRDMFDDNPLASRMQTLSMSLQKLAVEPPAAGDTQRFRDLVNEVRAVEALLSREELEWVFAHDFNLGPSFSATLAEMQRSPFLGAAFVNEIQSAGRADWLSLQQLLAYPAPVTGSILAARAGRPEMRLSPDAVLLKSGLDAFLVQGFVSSAPQGRRLQIELPQGRRLVWDPVMLDQAVAVARAYDRFRENGLRLFPNDLRTAIDGVARERARSEMSDRLGAAEHFEPVPPMNEEELRTQITGFASSIPPLNEVLDAFARLGSNEPRRDVAYAVTAEAARLLHAVDHLLAEYQPYRPRQGGFAWWDGTGAPSPAGWDARDGAELAAYLDTTRGRIAVLARNYAQPLLTWMTKAGTRERSDVRELAAKWQGILDDLRDHDAKKPGNAITLLDEYIATQLPKLRPSDCAAGGLPAGFRGSRGFFATSMQDLSRDVTSRCYALTGRDANERYAELARFFNARLKDRYPFADGMPGATTPEVEAADVRAFYKLFDASQAVIRAMPADGPFGEARRFIEDMATVRAFFAPFLDAPKPDPAPAFDVEPTFRVLRERELGGDQIMEWAVTIGNETVTSRDKGKKLRWTPDEKVKLSLRWASNAPMIPVLKSARRGARVADRTVVYEYTNRWALLAALTDPDHKPRAEQLPAYTDAQPVTLALSVDTEPAHGGGPAEKMPTLVFLRLALLAPGSTQTVDIPKFRTNAPKLAEVVR